MTMDPQRPWNCQDMGLCIDLFTFSRVVVTCALKSELGSGTTEKNSCGQKALLWYHAGLGIFMIWEKVELGQRVTLDCTITVERDTENTIPIETRSISYQLNYTYQHIIWNPVGQANVIRQKRRKHNDIA